LHAFNPPLSFPKQKYNFQNPIEIQVSSQLKEYRENSPIEIQDLELRARLFLPIEGEATFNIDQNLVNNSNSVAVSENP